MANSATPYCWDEDPSGNANADSAISLPPGTLEANLIDDRMRALMSVVKKHFDDRDYGCTVSGGANGIVLTGRQNIDTLEDGMVLLFEALSNNTAAVTINLNSIGAKPLRDKYNNEMVGGEIVAGVAYWIRYDGTRFRLLSPGADNGAPALLKGFTLGGGPTAYTLSASTYTVPEETGTMIGVIPNKDSEGNVTLAINGGASRSIRNVAGQHMLPGQFRIGRYYLLRWVGDGSIYWQVVNTTLKDDFSSLGFGTGGSGSAYTIATATANTLETLYDGLLIMVIWHVDNDDTSVTLKLNDTAATPLKLHDLEDPLAGDLVGGTADFVRYNEAEDAWIVLTKDRVGPRTYTGIDVGSVDEFAITNDGTHNEDQSGPIIIDQAMLGSGVDVIMRGHYFLNRAAYNEEGPYLHITPMFHNGSDWVEAGDEEDFTPLVTAFVGEPHAEDEDDPGDEQKHISPRRWGGNYVFIFHLNNGAKNSADTWRVGVKAKLSANDSGSGQDSNTTVTFKNVDIMFFEKMPPP